MNYTSLGALASAAACLVALGVHVIRYAYSQGQVCTRLGALEKTSDASTAVHSVLAALSANVAALEKSIARLDAALERMGEKVSRVSGGRGA